MDAGPVLVGNSRSNSHTVSAAERSIDIAEGEATESVQDHEARARSHLARQGTRQRAVQEVGPQLGWHDRPHQHLADEGRGLGSETVKRADVNDDQVISAPEQAHDVAQQPVRDDLSEPSDSSAGENVEPGDRLQVP